MTVTTMQTTAPSTTQTGTSAQAWRDLGWLLARATHVVGSAVERQLEVLGLGKRGFLVLKAAACLRRPSTPLTEAFTIMTPWLSSKGIVETTCRSRRG